MTISAIEILLLISIITACMPYYLQPVEGAFSRIENLSDNTGFSSDPQIAVSDNHVYVVWVDFTTGNWDIFFRASNDNGATFGKAVNLSNNAGESSNPKRSDLPQIAVSDNHVYVVWVDFTTGNWDIFFRASNDNGATFGDAVSLSNNAGESGRPRIAVSDNHVYVVWVDFTADNYIVFRASNDNGATFGDAVSLSNNAGESSNPNEESSNPKRSDLPQIAVSDNHVYVVWVDYIPGNYDIVFRASDDNGATFGKAVNLETSAGLTDLPQIAASSNNVYVMWDDYSLAEGLDIFFRASDDNGATFGSGVSLIRNVGYSASSPVAVSGNNVYVISAVGNIDIFFRASDDNGATFSKAVNLSDNAREASSDPQMAISGSSVYAVWEDYAAGNPDIFFTTFVPSIDPQATETMLLLTDNGSVKVEVTMDTDMLETGHPVRFTLKFLNPATEELLQHANYSLMIMDENGNSLVDKFNMHAHDGTDTQSVTFSNTGSFTLSIEVTGLGLDEPYDSRYNGKASTTLMVVPEFPLSILAVMGIIVGTVIVITRFRNQG